MFHPNRFQSILFFLTYNIPRPSHALTTFLATATAPAATIKVTPLTNFRFIPLSSSFFFFTSDDDDLTTSSAAVVVVVAAAAAAEVAVLNDLDDIFSLVSCIPFFVTSLLATSVALRTVSLVFGTTTWTVVEVTTDGSLALGAGGGDDDDDDDGVALLLASSSPLPKNDFCAAVISLA